MKFVYDSYYFDPKQLLENVYVFIIFFHDSINNISMKNVFSLLNNNFFARDYSKIFLNIFNVDLTKIFYFNVLQILVNNNIQKYS